MGKNEIEEAATRFAAMHPLRPLRRFFLVWAVIGLMGLAVSGTLIVVFCHLLWVTYR